MKRDRAGDLPFSVFVGDTFRQSLLQTKTKNPDRLNKKVANKGWKRENRWQRTFVRTAMEAKEFPKLIPMTVCDDDGISMGACALPFGICRPFRDIKFWEGVMLPCVRWLVRPCAPRPACKAKKRTNVIKRRMPSRALISLIFCKTTTGLGLRSKGTYHLSIMVRRTFHAFFGELARHTVPSLSIGAAQSATKVPAGGQRQLEQTNSPNCQLRTIRVAAAPGLAEGAEWQPRSAHRKARAEKQIVFVFVQHDTAQHSTGTPT